MNLSALKSCHEVLLKSCCPLSQGLLMCLPSCLCIEGKALIQPGFMDCPKYVHNDEKNLPLCVCVSLLPYCSRHCCVSDSKASARMQSCCKSAENRDLSKIGARIIAKHLSLRFSLSNVPGSCVLHSLLSLLSVRLNSTPLHLCCLQWELLQRRSASAHFLFQIRRADYQQKPCALPLLNVLEKTVPSKPSLQTRRSPLCDKHCCSSQIQRVTVEVVTVLDEWLFPGMMCFVVPHLCRCLAYEASAAATILSLWKIPPRVSGFKLGADANPLLTVPVPRR